MTPKQIILRELKRLEADAEILATLRKHAKTASGTRLSAFGKAILEAGRESEIKGADMARILDVTPGAVSQHYNR